MKNENLLAILLAAGNGTRMCSDIDKPYLELSGKPIIYYSLKEFEDSNVQKIILMVNPGLEDYVQREIIETYHFTKVELIAAGGHERYASVYKGLEAAREHYGEETRGENSYVLIHDAARAFITAHKINTCIEILRESKACILGMPVKDTVKIVSNSNTVMGTPLRRSLWIVQTPQCFLFDEIYDAYSHMMRDESDEITDDGMVMERYGKRRIRMVEGGYDNIKITTQEDLITGELILRSRNNEDKPKNSH